MGEEGGQGDKEGDLEFVAQRDLGVGGWGALYVCVPVSGCSSRREGGG